MRLASGLLAIAVALRVAGCGENQERPLRVRLGDFQLNLDPATLSDVESRMVATLVHSGLVAVDIDGTVQARLAQSWKRVDPVTWEFTLRKGVTFTDGSVVKAKAVVRSLCWAMQPTHLYSWALASIEHRRTSENAVECTGLSTMDDSTVRIRESRPAPWLLEALDSPAGWIVGNPGAKPTAWGVRPGIGPYRIETIATGTTINLVGRIGGAIAPRARRVAFEHLPDPLVAAQRFAKGELDLMRVDAPQIVEFMARKRIELLQHRFGRVRVVLVNKSALGKKSFSEEQVRTFLSAYANAINRSRLASLTAGLGSPMSTAFPPAALHSTYTPSRMESDPTTLPAARLKLLTPNDPYSDLIAASLPMQIGNVTISYRAVDPSVLLAQYLAGDADLVSMLIDPTLHAAAFWAAFWTPASPFAAFGTAIPEFSGFDLSTDRDIDKAAAAVDQHGTWIGLLREDGRLAVSKRLQGLRLTRTGQVSLESLSLVE